MKQPDKSLKEKVAEIIRTCGGNDCPCESCYAEVDSYYNRCADKILALLPQGTKCPECKGLPENWTCNICNGTGKINTGSIGLEGTCEKCNGSGKATEKAKVGICRICKEQLEHDAKSAPFEDADYFTDKEWPKKRELDNPDKIIIRDDNYNQGFNLALDEVWKVHQNIVVEKDKRIKELEDEVKKLKASMEIGSMSKL